jgi:hypothetical protein
LKTIEFEQEQLLEAMANAAWTPYFFSGDPSIPVQSIAKLKSRDIFRLPMNSNPPTALSSATKIADWQFIQQKYEQDVQSLLNLSAVGLLNRASQIQTATEVNALLSELNGLIGATASVLADTLYKNTINALLDILGVRESIRQSLAAEQGLQVDNETLDKLVSPIVITGSPAFAREQDAERMLVGISKLAQVFGPAILSRFDVAEISKVFLDGLRIPTEGLILKEPAVDPNSLIQNMTAAEAQAIGPEQIQALLNRKGA